MNKAQKKFFAGASIIVAGIGYLIFTAANLSSVYYLTVSEALAREGKMRNTDLRIEGIVVPGSVKNNSRDMDIQFVMADEAGKKLSVDYHGIVPGGFKEDMKVIVEGRLSGAGGFSARTLATPCASRYEAADDVKPHS